MRDRPMATHELGEWLDKQLARFTYKAGWKFSIVGGRPSAFMMGAEYALQVVMTVPDTYNPTDVIKVGGRYPIYPIFYVEHFDADEFARFLANTIRTIEDHEAREWLRRDGVIWDNPHKDD